MCHLQSPALSFSLLTGRPERGDPVRDSKDAQRGVVLQGEGSWVLGQHLEVGSKIKYIEINGLYTMYENNNQLNM